MFGIIIPNITMSHALNLVIITHHLIPAFLCSQHAAGEVQVQGGAAVGAGQMVKSPCVELVRQTRSSQGQRRAIEARRPLNQGSSLTAAQVRGQGEVKVCLRAANEFTNMCDRPINYPVL